jgi:DNA-binding MarR family transcriptional regulator/N-acetylglutamate synthase-like GNAT family acetyltransferase
MTGFAARQSDRRIAAVRRFNRFFTQRLGVLREGLLDSPFSLTEVRLLYELAHRELPTASELARELGLDAGYLSRLLRRFERRGLVARQASPDDARRNLLRLTERGREVFAPLDRRARDEVAALLAELPASEQDRLVAAMGRIERLLAGREVPRQPYLLRPHQSGDMGWVVQRHGILYAEEYGWDERFEALVAGIVARFIERFDPRRERCWIAEQEGEPVGCVFLVQRAKSVAQLRLLLVEPRARGQGLGGRLVDECVRFARRAGYSKMMLWTNDVLHSARRLYEAAGFQLVREGPHESFGKRLTEQVWELPLREGGRRPPRRSRLVPSGPPASASQPRRARSGDADPGRQP